MPGPDRSMAQRVADRARRSPLIGRGLPALVKRAYANREAPGWAVDHLYRSGGAVAVHAPDGSSILLECRGDEYEPSQLFWLGLTGHQPESLLFWAFARDAETIVDVGAHLGIFSLLGARANPAARVLSFEPMPGVADRLLANVRLNELGNVEVITAAASSADGVARFWYVPGVSAPSSSGLERDFFSGVETERVTVATARLETLLGRMEPAVTRVDLVKIDVESHEPEVIAGMGALLSTRPTMFVEILPRTETSEAIHDAVGGLDYRFFELRPEGPVEVERLGRNAAIRNYLLTTRGDEVSGLWSAATSFNR